MAHVKIYALKNTIAQHRDALSNAIHDAVVDILKYPVEKKFHRFIGLDQVDFIYPSDRSSLYTIIEISMFEGRSKETKKELVKSVFTFIQAHTPISAQDIEVTLFETPKENWGIRGQCGDELVLNYKVNV
jgi:phenylpyruvate tautomerase PptA (4-oxalocrotonate tautomerase family)